MSRSMFVALAGSLTLGIACITQIAGAGGTEPPPSWFPGWLIPALSVVLPWVYQYLLGKLPGWLKTVLAGAFSGVIVAVLGWFVLGIRSLPALLANLAVLWAGVQFVYSLFVKPLARKLEALGVRSRFTLPVSSHLKRLERERDPD